MANLFYDVFVAFLLCSKAVSGLQWSNQLSDGDEVHACAGSDLPLAWNYTLGANEDVPVLQWYRLTSDLTSSTASSSSASGPEEEMLAMVNSHGRFVPMAALAGRVQFLPEAGITLGNVTGTDSGRYALEAVSRTGAGPFSVQRLAVEVVVAEPAVLDNDRLDVGQQRQAVFNNETGQWAVQLTCGHFASLGQPPVAVVWTTPDGELKNSTAYKDGYFFLTLENPVKGGNYVCSIDPASTAEQCMAPQALQNFTFSLDELESRLTLIEAYENGLGAENIRLEEKNRLLQQENDNLTSSVLDLTSKLQAQVEANANLTSNVSILEETVNNLAAYIQQLEQNLTSCYHDNDELRSFVQEMTSSSVSDTTMSFDTATTSEGFDLANNTPGLDSTTVILDSTTTDATATSTTGPCAAGNHTVLDDAWRDVNITEGNHCDNRMVDGWYRFTLNGSDAIMPTSCVTEGGCGTAVSIWLDLQGNPVPAVGFESQAQACGVGAYGCCVYHDGSVTIRNCGNFFVYNLGHTRCNHAYCAILP